MCKASKNKIKMIRVAQLVYSSGHLRGDFFWAPRNTARTRYRFRFPKEHVHWAAFFPPCCQIASPFRFTPLLFHLLWKMVDRAKAWWSGKLGFNDTLPGRSISWPNGCAILERVKMRTTEKNRNPGWRKFIKHGLFAAGATGQGGLLLKGHGHHLAWAFTSGRRAGRSAAFEVTTADLE